MNVEKQVVLTINKAETWIIYRALVAYQSELTDRGAVFPDVTTPMKEAVGEMLTNLYGLWAREYKEDDE